MRTMNQLDDNSSNGNTATIVAGTAVAAPATDDATLTIEAEKVCHDYENNSCHFSHHHHQHQRQKQPQQSLEVQLERQTQIATQRANDKVNNNNVESSLASPTISSGVVVVPSHHQHNDDHGEDSPASYVVQTVKLTSDYTSRHQSKPNGSSSGGSGDRRKSSGQNSESLVESSHVSRARATLPVDGDSECCYVSGENLRCNCAGTRRTTLSGLIELFEQGVTLTTTNNNSPDHHRSSPSGAWQDRWRRRQHHHQQQRRRRKARELHSYGLNRGQARRTRGVSTDKQMRDIITPVKYEPSEEEEEDCDEETDSLEYLAADTGPNLTDGAETPDSAIVNRSLRHHVTVKGVPVLPCSKGQLRKLTATNWQPPTDARKYDSLRPASRNSRLHYQYGTTSRNRVHPESVYFSDDEVDNNKPEDGPEEEDQDECNRNNQERYSRTAQLAATGGPSIVKHQPSSSRRLLNQLARLRRLSEPQYRVKRPEKVAQVESLIDQLERATADWEDDEQLLDRAERRDWPQEYHTRFASKRPQSTVHNQHNLSTEKAKVKRRADVHPFEEQTIARSHSVLAMAASTLTTMTTTTTRTTSTSAEDNVRRLPLDADGVQQRSATLGRKPRRKPAALADRYHDDLAVRRLGNRSPASQSRGKSPGEPMLSNLPQMSYLLCSSAYTPSIESGRQSSNRKQQLLDWNSDSLDRRLRADDLHYRSVKNSQLPPPHEPPFGIPRQPSLASAHSTGSHYLRHQNSRETPNTGQECNYIRSQRGGQSRPESKVSFRDDHTSGFASADSGLVTGGLSPSSMGGRLSAASRLTPSSPSILERQPRPQSRGPSDHLQQQQARQQVLDDYVDDAADEVDLDDQLQGVDQETLAEWLSEDVHCDSPTLECYRAQVGSAPTRRRPKINIANPRSKSPLVKVVDSRTSKSSSHEPQAPKVSNDDGAQVQVRSYTDAERWRPSSGGATSELECQYLFNDDEEDDDVVGENDTAVKKPLVSTTRPETSGESSMNESSIERLNYRGVSRSNAGNMNEEAKMRSGSNKKDTDKKAPLFSIGQYKPMLNKPQLKIL